MPGPCKCAHLLTRATSRGEAASSPTRTVYIGTASQGTPTDAPGWNTALTTPTAAPGAVFINPGTTNSTHYNYASPIVACPDANNDNITFPYYINGSAFTYTIQCDTDYGIWGSVRDIQISAGPKTLTECIDLCSTFNIQLPQGSTSGGAVGFSGFCSGIYFGSKACHLKSGLVSGYQGHSGEGHGARLNKAPEWLP